ncbi:hypothetical protein ABVK25_004741 [Lepraria finkii]|uniref:Uncharacterized protein n=1 Tax=Lepraria finkii TaxID=1340010 RepID=A0ABR4BDN8_9LECA
MDHNSRRIALYNGFDSISEPGHRPQPMFMRRTKTRRSRTALALSILCVLLLVWGWRSSGIGITPVASRLSNMPLSHFPQIAIAAPELVSDAEAPLIPPPPVNTTQMGLQKTNPVFHLLIPASESNPDLCKTVLS